MFEGPRLPTPLVAKLIVRHGLSASKSGTFSEHPGLGTISNRARTGDEICIFRWKTATHRTPGSNSDQHVPPYVSRAHLMQGLKRDYISRSTPSKFEDGSLAGTPLALGN